MLKIMLVGFGGFAGSASRFMLGSWVNRMLKNPLFPYGTLAVNILGCLLIGFLAGIAEQRWFTAETQLLVILGFLGGFTTFSTFGYETFSLMSEARMPAATLNIAGQVFFGLAAVWLGRLAAALLPVTS